MLPHATHGHILMLLQHPPAAYTFTMRTAVASSPHGECVRCWRPLTNKIKLQRSNCMAGSGYPMRRRSLPCQLLKRSARPRVRVVQLTSSLVVHNSAVRQSGVDPSDWKLEFSGGSKRRGNVSTRRKRVIKTLRQQHETIARTQGVARR